MNQESGIILSLNHTPDGIVLFPVIVVIDAWAHVSVFYGYATYNVADYYYGVAPACTI